MSSPALFVEKVRPVPTFKTALVLNITIPEPPLPPSPLYEDPPPPPPPVLAVPADPFVLFEDDDPAPPPPSPPATEALAPEPPPPLVTAVPVILEDKPSPPALVPSVPPASPAPPPPPPTPPPAPVSAFASKWLAPCPGCDALYLSHGGAGFGSLAVRASDHDN